MSAYASTQKSISPEVEFGAQFIHNQVGQGFEDYMRYAGKFMVGALDMGCESYANITISVIDATHVQGEYSGYAECAPQPCIRQWEDETITASVNSTDGFNTSGKNQTLTTNISIAQPKSSPGYIADGSYFSVEANFLYAEAGTGTISNPKSECETRLPGSYETGPTGLCQAGYMVSVGQHSFPTPLPMQAPGPVYVWDVNNTNEVIDICAGYGPCALPESYCSGPYPTCYNQ